MYENMTPSYYAILPANVRYDERLIPNAKLLFGEITSLTHKEGYCWASNKYFSTLYKVSPTTVSLWINTLIKYGYIKSETIQRGDISQRLLYLSTPSGKAEPPLLEKQNPPSGKAEPNSKYNIKTNKKTIGAVRPEQTPSEMADKRKKVILRKKADKIISKLNELAKRKYKNTDSNRKFITARLNEGYTYSDCITVIETKIQDPYFISNPQYLRPSTLFNASNFDAYLNEDPADYKNNNSQSDDTPPDNPYDDEFTAPFVEYMTHPTPYRLRNLYENLGKIEKYYNTIDNDVKEKSQFGYFWPGWRSFSERYLKYLINDKSFAEGSPGVFDIDKHKFWGDFKKYIEDMIQMELDYKPYVRKSKR